MNSILLMCGLALGLICICEARYIILNEVDLLGTCNKDCHDVPTMYHKFNCKKLSKCQINSTGYRSYLATCNYCRCKCEVDYKKDVLVEKKTISIKERDLLNTCRQSCNRRGLVRSNFRGCQEVRDCWKSGNGRRRRWLRRWSKKIKKGLRRGSEKIKQGLTSGYRRFIPKCDYCACKCINRRYAKEYRLENVKYDFSEANLKELENGKPIMVSETILQNSGKMTQEVVRELQYTTSESTSMSMTRSIEVGLSVTVGASATIKGVAELSASVERSVKMGFSYTAGSTKVESRSDKVTVSVKVPPKSSIKAEVIGTELKIDIPYTATLVIKHNRGGGETRKSVTGFLSDVHTARIRVNYHAAKKG